MALNPSNSSNLEQLALKGLKRNVFRRLYKRESCHSGHISNISTQPHHTVQQSHHLSDTLLCSTSWYIWAVMTTWRIRWKNCVCCIVHRNYAYITSNVTSRHWGPKQKLQAGYTGYRVPSLERTSHMLSSSVKDVIFFVVECSKHHIFHHQVWYHMLSLRCACIRRSGIILIP